ncbi:MAG: AI-2E family transporter [Chloroflexota bacterium]
MEDSNGTRNQEPEIRRTPITPFSLFVALLVLYLVIEVRIVVLLLIFAILFATIIERPVIRLEHRGLPRAGAIISVYVGIFAAIIGISFFIVPPITQEAMLFWDEAPTLIEDLAEEWRTSGNSLLSTTGYRLLSQLQFRIENPPPPTGNTAIGLLGSIGGVSFGIVATFVIGFYYLMEKQLFRNLVLDLMARNNRERVNTLWDEVESKVGDWLRGQITLMIIIGVSAGVGYMILDLRFWLLLAVVAGITEAIPIIGPWIGGIPAVAVALVDSWEKALIVAVFLGLLQLAENTILVPRVMRGAIGLSPLAVFIAVMAGGQFAGVLGAFLALPVAAAVQVVIQDEIRLRRGELHMEPAGKTAIDSLTSWGSVLSRFLPATFGGDRGNASDDPPQADEPQPGYERESEERH